MAERPRASEPAIEAHQLTRRYGELVALDHVDLEVRRGEVFGLLGPNGAGKTTTIRLLTGLLRPTEGGARVLGMDLVRDVTRIKKCVGVVPESSNLYAELSAYDNLLFSMQLYGVPRRERRPRAKGLLSHFRLSEKRDTPFAALSRGMKRSLTIAAALAHRPDLIYLDEPTTGLDVMSARSLRQMIAGLSGEGVTVFLTTHYLEEAERLCDRIALLVQGRIVALDTVDGLKARVQGTTAVEAVLEDEGGNAETQRITGEDVAGAMRHILAQAEAQEQRVRSVRTVQPSLEDAFVQLTGLRAEVMRTEKGRGGG